MTTPLLAIDTGAPRLQLALLNGVHCDVMVEEMAQGQAERLFPAIGALLARNDLSYADLRRVAVTTGPGSFTGLRIGLSAARGLGLANDIPIIGVPTLLALSLVADGPALVTIDARRGERYVQSFAGPGLPLDDAEAVANDSVATHGTDSATVLDTPFVDIAALARFAATAEPAAFPPHACYIRGADAKPQEKFRVARVAG